ncbi:MAG: ABC transporter ATP-binding protein [Pirellulaceae bacterium]
MAQVVLDSVSKTFADGTSAVEQLSLRVDDREFLVLVGPSGCGKSTTLRLIAGLEQPTSGQIRIGERVVNATPPRDRDIAMVFQNYALYPHMSVYRNLSFGLELRYGGSFGARVLRQLVNPRRAAVLEELRRGIDLKVRQAAMRLGIESLLNRKPHQLSGGERQRVALGRAIVRNPAAFLFDEPLSNLDAKLRQQMRTELKQLHQGLAATMIYVTHDQVEAMTLGDRVAVMDRGRLQQIAEPQTIYDQPANIFVARFFGSTPINLASGRWVRSEQETVFECGPIRWKLPAALASLRATSGTVDTTLGFRAEDVILVSTDNAKDSRFSETPFAKVRIEAIDHWGDSAVVHLQVPAGVPVPAAAASGSRIWFARLPKGNSMRIGDEVNLCFDPTRLLWFDTATEKNLMT